LGIGVSGSRFFRRAYELIRVNGVTGLLATNTIAQGDTRESGLLRIRSVVMSLRLNRFGDFDNPSTAGFGFNSRIGATLFKRSCRRAQYLQSSSAISSPGRRFGSSDQKRRRATSAA
jgi:hypothetical protein